MALLGIVHKTWTHVTFQLYTTALTSTHAQFPHFIKTQFPIVHLQCLSRAKILRSVYNQTCHFSLHNQQNKKFQPEKTKHTRNNQIPLIPIPE